jgi:multiple sugar transport system ATP-binding protein
MNVVDVTVQGERVVIPGAEGLAFPPALLAQVRGAVSFGIRPEALEVSLASGDGFIPAEAHIIEPLGSHDIIDLKVGRAMLRARVRSGFVAVPGTGVFVRADPGRAHFFDRASGVSLGVRL